MWPRIQTYLAETTQAAPLAAFRVFFGVMMLASVIRFWSYGWIKKLYIDPAFFFSYYGFEFVKPLGVFTYGLFAICGLAALMVALGYRYRLAIITFFLSFTYIELMDKTTYLNHYYFISVLSFVMIFLPANAYFSLDARRNPSLAFQYIPRWSIDAVKLLLGIVYFYAGLAKLNSDWLIEAMPLSIWLPSKYSLPIIGDLLQVKSVIYLFSWGGAFFDLSIAFLLLIPRTRVVAYILVVVFHLLTGVLFPIGMFPYIMIVSATIFFSAQFHLGILGYMSKIFRFVPSVFDNGKSLTTTTLQWSHQRLAILALFFFFQIVFPFRYLAYPGELFWTEQGYRFSWRVMLMEKAGHATFKVASEDGKQFYVDNSQFLTAFQEKQMATQPDFMVQYATHLKKHFENTGLNNVAIYVESYVALNGRKSRPYIDPAVNLAAVNDSFKPKTWILPFDDKIKGL